MLAGGGGELFAGGAGDGLCQIEQGMIFALAEVLGLEKFGEADDLSRRVRRRRRRVLGLSLDSVPALGRKTFAPGLRGICQGARGSSSADQYSIWEAGFGLRLSGFGRTGRWSFVVGR